MSSTSINNGVSGANDCNNVPKSPKASSNGGKPPRARRPNNQKTKTTKSSPLSKGNSSGAAQSTMSMNQRKHIVRVKVLGLAGITKKREEVIPSPKGRKSKKVKQVAKTMSSGTIPPPENLKAVAVFSRNQKIKGTSLPSLPLTKSSTAPIVITNGRQATIDRNAKDNRDTGALSNVEDIDSVQPPYDRFIAVWGDTPYSTEDNRTTVFETTLHRAISTNVAPSGEEMSVGASSATSSAFAPKSFEVTIALGDETYKRSAFSIGVATLAISGDECIKEGKAKVMDLPVLSLEQAQPIVGGAGGKTKPWLPVITMQPPPSPSPSSLGQTVIEATDTEVEALNPNAESEIGSAVETKSEISESGQVPKKKKKGFSRFFRKKKKVTVEKKTKSFETSDISDTESNIKKLMSTSEEKEAFSQIYGIDPSDAVMRVSVEVYEKGSDLEKMFENGNQNRVQPLTKNQSFEVGTTGSIAESRSKPLIEMYSDDEEENTNPGGEGDSYTNDNTNDNTNTTLDTYGGYTRKLSKPSVFNELNDALGACTAPCVQQNSACAAIIDNDVYEGSFDSEENSYEPISKKKKKMQGKNKNKAKIVNSPKMRLPRSSRRTKKSESSSSPRSVNDLKLSREDRSSSSKTDSREATSTLSYTNSIVSNNKSNSLRNGSVMQTIKDVLQCSTNNEMDDDFVVQYDRMSLNPPTVIDETFEEESIGNLTDITYEYENQKIVKTMDLNVKVSPKVVLAEKGKSLTGLVLLPAAFGGDGMCVPLGARLILKHEAEEKQKKKTKKEDYERIFFREQKELDPIEASRLMRLKADNDPGKDADTDANIDEMKVKSSPRSTPHCNPTKYDGPVSAVYEVHQDRMVGDGKSVEYRNIDLCKTTSTEHKVMHGDDRYGGNQPSSPLRKGILRN